VDSRKKDSGKREIVWLLLIGLIVVILCVSTTSLFLVLKHFTGKRQPQPCYVFDLYGTVQKAKNMLKQQKEPIYILIFMRMKLEKDNSKLFRLTK